MKVVPGLYYDVIMFRYAQVL